MRGFGPNLATAFAQAAIALTAVVCDPVEVKPLKSRSFECEAPDREMLLVEWLDALANRQILTHLTREAFREVLPQADMPLLYDVSHNTCKVETHDVDGRRRALFVHRKGATPRFRARSSGLAGEPACNRPTGADRRQHGNGALMFLPAPLRAWNGRSVRHATALAAP